MTATSTAETAGSPSREVATVALPEPGASRRVGFGVAAVALGLIMLMVFGLGSEPGLDATFVFSRGSEAIEVPDLTISARFTALALGGVAIAVGVGQVGGVLRRRSALVFGVVLALFVIALLAWAARGGDTNILGLLNGTIRRAIPIALGAMAGLLCERAGVINIGIEGMLLTAAFVGALTGSATGSLWAGMVLGIGAGALLGAVLAVLSIRFRVDQIIGGTVINIFALGLTGFLTAQVLREYAHLNRPGSFAPFTIPPLDRLPLVGPLLFRNTIYVYAMFALVFGLAYALFRTRWGLRVRAVGEHPAAADTVGIPVLRTRYRSVILGGAVAGLGGTWFTLDATGSFNEGMTAGRGFIALAALIFGRWHPVGAFVAALVFGFSEELQGRLALLDTPIPGEILLMTPFVVTIVVVAGLVGRSRPPAADGKVYERA